VRTDTGLTVPFTDPNDWTLAKVLRQQAAARPDAIYLDAPEEGQTWTYAEVLRLSENVAQSLLHAGAERGDRVLIQAVNSSQLLFTWFAAALSGMVEVPINTAYEFDFLSHQIRTADPRTAVIDDVFAQRFADIADDCTGIKTFWVIDTGELDGALKTHGRCGCRADRARGTRARRDLLHLRHHRPVQGSRDVALPVLLRRRRTGEPDPADRR
jgi:crotonobetaine/carnitine-CoA ligase